MSEKVTSDAGYVRERIDGASVRLRNGRVFTHNTHYDALCDAFAFGAFPEFATASDEIYEAAKTDAILERFRVECGFVTTSGRFVNREEAHQIATVSGQVITHEQLPERHAFCAESLIFHLK